MIKQLSAPSGGDPDRLIDTYHEVQPPARLILRTECRSDSIRLQGIVPLDQTRMFIARWNGIALEFEQAPDVQTSAAPTSVIITDDSKTERSRLSTLSDDELAIEAAERKVKWDRKASRETMLDRIAAAPRAKTTT